MAYHYIFVLFLWYVDENQEDAMRTALNIDDRFLAMERGLPVVTTDKSFGDLRSSVSNIH